MSKEEIEEAKDYIQWEIGDPERELLKMIDRIKALNWNLELLRQAGDPKDIVLKDYLDDMEKDLFYRKEEAKNYKRKIEIFTTIMKILEEKANE